MIAKATASWGALCVACMLLLFPRPALCDPLLTEDGQRALGEGRYDEAWQLLGPLAAAPKAPGPVRFWAAEAAIKLNRCADALPLLQHLEADLMPVADEIFARRARCHEVLGDTDGAQAAWHEVLAHRPPKSLGDEARFALGGLWLQKNNPVAAVVALKEAVRLAPSDVRSDAARLQVAKLQQLQGNAKGAQTELMRLVATARDPVAQEAASALRTLTSEHPEWAQQAPPPSRAALEDGEGPPSWQTASSVRDAQRLLAQKKPDAAVAALRRLLQVASKPKPGGRGGRATKQPKTEQVAIANALGNMLGQLGRTPEAIAVFDQLAQALPQGTKKQDAQFRAAYLSYDGKNYLAAYKRFGAFLTANPRHRSADEALWFRAWCSFHLGHLENALLDVTRLRDQYPKSSMVPRAQWWSIRFLTLVGRSTEAIPLQQALLVQPGYYGMLARRAFQHPAEATTEGASVTTPRAVPQAAAPPAAAGPSLRVVQESITGQTLDDEKRAFIMAQGTQVLDWSGPIGVRVSTLIALNLTQEAAAWVPQVRGGPGVPGRQAALGRGQILFALGDYARAMSQAVPLLPPRWEPDPDPQLEMALRLAYPPAFGIEVTRAASAFGTSEVLLLSLMRQESAFNSRASSQVSAKGLMQIMPSTGRRIAQELRLQAYSDAQLLAPELNIHLASWYITALLRRFGGNLPVAIGSYNAGPKATQRWLEAAHGTATDVFVEDIPYRETRDYIKKVLANVEMYARIYGGALPPWPDQVLSAPQGVDF